MIESFSETYLYRISLTKYEMSWMCNNKIDEKNDQFFRPLHHLELRDRAFHPL